MRRLVRTVRNGLDASPGTARASTSARASAWAADVESLAMRLARGRGGGVDERELGELRPVHLDDEGDPVRIPPREVLAGVLLGGGVLNHEGGIRTPLDHPAPELVLGVRGGDGHDRERDPGVTPRVPGLARAL